MPNTPIFGWPFESPLDQPGISLTGGSSGLNEILAEEVEEDLQAQIAALQAQINTFQADIDILQAEKTQRIATTTVTTDSAAITTTETAVMTVVAPVVIGQVYQVRAVCNLDGTVADDTFLVRLREDSVAGTIIQAYRFVITNTASAIGAPPPEARYVADATENKTFVLSLVRSTGTGSIQLDADPTFPAYLYVDLIG